MSPYRTMEQCERCADREQEIIDLGKEIVELEKQISALQSAQEPIHHVYPPQPAPIRCRFCHYCTKLSIKACSGKKSFFGKKILCPTKILHIHIKCHNCGGNYIQKSE